VLRDFFRASAAGVLASGFLCAPPCAAIAQTNSGSPQMLPTGQTITPLAPTGSQFQALNPNLADNPSYTAENAVTGVLSPDGKTLLILTSGYNIENYSSGADAGQVNPTDSTEFVFVFDVSSGTPVQKQALPVPNTYSGIAFNPNGLQFYVAGGKDDCVHIFSVAAGVWSETQTPVALGHLALADSKTYSYGGLGLFTDPIAAGLAVSQNGALIVVCDYDNDAISILSQSGSEWTKSGEFDLRPGVISPSTETGVAGGEYPYWVQIKGNSTAYVTSQRDREVDVVNIAGTPSLITRIPVPGNPNRALLRADQTTLYVAQDNTDSIAVIATSTNQVTAEINVTAPAALFPNPEGLKGATPDGLALSPDGNTLYVTDGGLNAVAVIGLNGSITASAVVGLIPTGFYPNSVSVSADGKQLYIVNGKSVTGPNPLYCDVKQAADAGTGQNCDAGNQFTLQLAKAGFQTVPTPDSAQLQALTAQVMTNDRLPVQPTSIRLPRPVAIAGNGDAVMAELRNKIKHVIYIIRENRTYDQILGDLDVGNGDPSLAQFPEATTPNAHAFADKFVDFDNFYDVSAVSGDGWPWSTSARTTDNLEKGVPIYYASRSTNLDGSGINRNINMGIAVPTNRTTSDPLLTAGTPDPNLLPGTSDVAAPDSSDGGAGEGYIWNAAKQAGLSVRNYGFFIDLERYTIEGLKQAIPLDPTPYADNLQVAYSSNAFLSPYTDIYFRGFDLKMPDYFRFNEWNREFQQFDANNNLPSLSLVRFGNDHTGSFAGAIDGVNTPELQVADNDYAVGLLADAVAHSKNYAGNTLIFVIEDDAQDGGDHVSAHRSTAYIIGPYVRQGRVISTFYNTINFLRTMEEILGMPPMNLNDANAVPMSDAFDLSQASWTYVATPSTYLASTALPIPASAFEPNAIAKPVKPLHNAAWWAAQSKGMDFDEEDEVETGKYNRIVWKGVMGSIPYPNVRSGRDLRANRAELLKKFHARRAAQQTAVAKQSK
jgi:YVTN family beta-propeller protein